jgi:hypothetical protein
MRINVQVEEGSAEFVTLEQFVVENHPENSIAGPCNVCESKDNQPAARVGYPPFHLNCVCEVVWKEI